MSSCSTFTLKNGDNIATFKGAKVFSPTVMTLSEGNCPIPTVDSSGVVTNMQWMPDSANQCKTVVATTNGVDLKGLANIMLTTLVGVLAGI